VRLSVQLASLVIQGVAIVRIAGCGVISDARLGKLTLPGHDKVQIFVNFLLVVEVTALVVFGKTAR